MRVEYFCFIFLLFMALSLGIPTQARDVPVTSHYYVNGQPKSSVRFPEETFKSAKKLKSERKFNHAAALLKVDLEKARQSARGTNKLAKYLVRLNNCLYDDCQDEEAIKYGEIASKIFDRNVSEKKADIAWIVNIESYLAMGYARTKQYKKAIPQFKTAIRIANSAPSGVISATWIKTLNQQMEHTKQLSRHWGK